MYYIVIEERYVFVSALQWYVSYVHYMYMSIWYVPSEKLLPNGPLKEGHRHTQKISYSTGFSMYFSSYDRSHLMQKSKVGPC